MPALAKPHWPELFKEIIRMDERIKEMKAESVIDFDEWKFLRRRRRDNSMMAERVLHWNPTGRKGGPQAARWNNLNTSQT